MISRPRDRDTANRYDESDDVNSLACEVGSDHNNRFCDRPRPAVLAHSPHQFRCAVESWDRGGILGRPLLGRYRL